MQFGNSWWQVTWLSWTRAFFFPFSVGTSDTSWTKQHKQAHKLRLKFTFQVSNRGLCGHHYFQIYNRQPHSHSMACVLPRVGLSTRAWPCFWSTILSTLDAFPLAVSQALSSVTLLSLAFSFLWHALSNSEFLAGRVIPRVGRRTRTRLVMPWVGLHSYSSGLFRFRMTQRYAA